MLTITALFVAGLATGVVTGLLPGLHPNTVIVLSLPFQLGGALPLMPYLAFITGMSIVHTFVSFIPSIFLAAPEAATALGVLPGQGFVERGRGYEAVLLTVHGGIIAAVVALLILPILLIGAAQVYDALAPLLPVLLSGALILLVWRENKRVQAATITALSAVLGYVSLNSPAANTTYILFPLLAGMFGVAHMLLLLRGTGGIPRQTPESNARLKHATRGGVLGAGGGLLAGFLPGLGAAQSAVVIDEFFGLTRADFLAAIGGINTADLFFSLAALYLIGNPRSGTAVAIQYVAAHLTPLLMGTVIGFAIIAVGIGALITPLLARHATTLLTTIDYRKLLVGVMGIIVAGTMLLTGAFGLTVLGTATALGVYTRTQGVRASLGMAALIVPTIIATMP